MAYYVIHPNGLRYGPADIPLLKQWVSERRIVASTILEDEATGQHVPAADVKELGFQQEQGAPETEPQPQSQPAPEPPPEYGPHEYPGNLGPITAPRTNTNAIASLVLGILSLIFWTTPIIGFPISIIGIYLGVRALNSRNRGMAIAGVVLSVLGLIGTIAVVIWASIYLSHHPVRYK